MAPREVATPGKPHRGKHRVFATKKRQWDKLCESYPAAMRRCYMELVDNPFPPGQRERHHELKGRLMGYWEYEVTGGGRVRYKRGRHGEVVVVYAGPAPADTH